MANFNPPVFTITKTTAARARHLTPGEWIHRAVELAWKEHTIGMLRYHSTDSDGNHLYVVNSRSHPQSEHMLVINLRQERCTCDCTAANWGSPCSHVGAALYIMQQIIGASITRNMEGQRQYEWWARSQENAG